MKQIQDSDGGEEKEDWLGTSGLEKWHGDESSKLSVCIMPDLQLKNRQPKHANRHRASKEPILSIQKTKKGVALQVRKL